MKRSWKRRLLLPLLNLLMLTPALSNADIAIIVNKEVVVGKVTQSQITALFLQQSKKINDVYLTPLDLTQRTEIREKFYRKLANKTPLQMKAYWSRLVFTGKGEPPMEFENSEEVLVTVASDENYIGYINVEDVDDTVNVIFKIQE